MALTYDRLHELAHALIDAEHTRTPVAPLTAQAPDLTVEDAYVIAADVLGHQLGHGHRVVGRKVGFTNPDVRERLGVHSPNFGTLLDDMTVRDGGRIDRATLIHPQVEPEIAFRLRAPLEGPGVTLDDVLAATDHVFPALEIVDSRFEGWRFEEPDAVADNACAAMVVVGSMRLPPDAIDLAGEAVVLYRNDAEACRGISAAVLGNPANAVAWCANALAESGQGLRAGEFVMTGSIAGVTAARAGDSFRAEYANLGIVSARFT